MQRLSSLGWLCFTPRALTLPADYLDTSKICLVSDDFLDYLFNSFINVVYFYLFRAAFAMFGFFVVVPAGSRRSGGLF